MTSENPAYDETVEATGVDPSVIPPTPSYAEIVQEAVKSPLPDEKG